MYRNNKILMVLLGLLLASCSATGPKFSRVGVHNDAATVYIYRPDTLCAGAGTRTFAIDGRTVAKLNNKGYTVLKLHPGTHKIAHYWQDDVTNRLLKDSFTVEAGKEYYLRFTTICNTSGFSPNTIVVQAQEYLNQVEESDALYEITESDCRYQAPLSRMYAHGSVGKTESQIPVANVSAEKVVAKNAPHEASGEISDLYRKTGRLNYQEIRALLSNKTVNGYQLMYGYKFKRYFSADGSMYTLKNNVLSKGSWRISGNQLCTRVKGKDEYCRYVQMKNRRAYRHKPDGTAVVEYRSIDDGNTIQF